MIENAKNLSRKKYSKNKQTIKAYFMAEPTYNDYNEVDGIVWKTRKHDRQIKLAGNPCFFISQLRIKYGDQKAKEYRDAFKEVFFTLDYSLTREQTENMSDEEISDMIKKKRESYGPPASFVLTIPKGKISFET